MTTLNSLLASAKTTFDLNEPADQESLYALTSTLLAMSDLTSDALQATVQQSDTPLEFKLAAKLVK